MSHQSQLIQQAGSICWVEDKIVLVSNKGRTRWVLPKGHLESNDVSLAERARCEAWEEAGVKTHSVAQPTGQFVYAKRGGLYQVWIFQFEDCDLAATWPELSLRTRVLVEPQAASEMVNEPDLKAILLTL